MKRWTAKRLNHGWLLGVLAFAGCGGGSPLCAAGELRCDGSDVLRCSDDGAAWDVAQTCGAAETCTEGACVGIAICEPAATECDGDDVVQCSTDGTAWNVVETCGAREACVAGACEPVVICEPGVIQCDGDDVVQCSADGTEWAVQQTCLDGEACTGGACTIIYGIETLEADRPIIVEGDATPVRLTATHRGTPRSFTWRQIGGHPVSVSGPSAADATIDASAIEVGGDTVLTFELWAMWETGTPGSLVATDTATVEVVVRAVDLVPARSQIGGATIAAAELAQAGGVFALFNQGGRLHATPLGATGAISGVDVGAYIRDIDVVEHGGAQYALLALGAEGIGVVDVSDVGAMRNVLRVGVNYEKLGVTFAEGGAASSPRISPGRGAASPRSRPTGPRCGSRTATSASSARR